jgi:hypothetical protein
MPAWPPPRFENHLNFLSTMFSSGGVTPRGFKHFATSPTHPHRRQQRTLKRRETPLATKPQCWKKF